MNETTNPTKGDAVIITAEGRPGTLTIVFPSCAIAFVKLDDDGLAVDGGTVQPYFFDELEVTP